MIAGGFGIEKGDGRRDRSGHAPNQIWLGADRQGFDAGANASRDAVRTLGEILR